jgi:hypothetical protein
MQAPSAMSPQPSRAHNQRVLVRPTHDSSSRTFPNWKNDSTLPHAATSDTVPSAMVTVPTK